MIARYPWPNSANSVGCSGASANRVRKSFIVASHLVSAAAMAACALGSAPVAIGGLFMAGLAFGMNSPNLYAIGQTLAGPRAGGKWIGFQNCIGNIAGIVAPIVTGMLIDRTGAFTWAFAVAGLVALTGVASWTLLVRRIAPLDWSVRTASAV